MCSGAVGSQDCHHRADWRTRLRRLADRGALCAWLIFALAWVLRSLVAWHLPAAVIWEDGYRYVKIADILWFEGNGFGGIYENWLSVPTQPLAIAAVFAVFGRSFMALRLVFAFIGAISCVLGWAIARRTFGNVAGLVAGLALATYPHLVYLSTLFEYPQTLCIFFMAVFFLQQQRFRRELRWPRLFVAGLFLGLATITIPSVLPYVPLFLLTLPSRRPAQWFGQALVVAMAVAIPLGSWAIRNYVAYGEFVLINKGAAQVFWAGNNDSYYQYGRGAVAPACAPGYEFTSHCKESKELDALLGPHADEGMVVIDTYVSESWHHGLEFVRNSPWRFVQLTARKAVQFWSPIATAVQATRQATLDYRDVISVVTSVPMLLLALASMVWLAPRWRELLPWYLYILTLWGLYSLFLPQMRYRLPLDYMLILIAAGGLSQFMTRNRP